MDPILRHLTSAHAALRAGVITPDEYEAQLDLVIERGKAHVLTTAEIEAGTDALAERIARARGGAHVAR